MEINWKIMKSLFNQNYLIANYDIILFGEYHRSTPLEKLEGKGEFFSIILDGRISNFLDALCYWNFKDQFPNFHGE
jgi:hypothetical protein